MHKEGTIARKTNVVPSLLAWATIAVAWAFSVQSTFAPLVSGDMRTVVARALMTLGAMAIGGIVWLVTQGRNLAEMREQMAFKHQGTAC